MLITRFRPAAVRLPVAFSARSACATPSKRFMASAAPHARAAPATAVKAAVVLGSLTSELDRLAPRFEVDAAQIEIISGPADFYAALKVPSLDAPPRTGGRCSWW